MELQVVVASLVAKFEFTPGAALHRAVDRQLASLEQKQQPEEGGNGLSGEEQRQAAVAQGVFDMAQYHVTLQPRAGMLLVAKARK
jgi:hypothetical protein